jgi:signal transduction histidine kinase
MMNALVFILKAAAVLTLAYVVRERRAPSTPRKPSSALAVQEARPPDAGQAILRERRRLASDIHDGALQFATCALNSLRQAHRGLERDHAAFQPLTDGVRFAEAAIDSIRTAIVPLASSTPVASGLTRRLERLLQSAARSSNMRIHVGPLPDLSNLPEVEEIVAGIVGEALTNAAQHANARNVWVDIQVKNDAVTGIVRDDGVGFNPKATERKARTRKHFGLYLIRERARLAGGEVTITSQSNAGTLVETRLPLHLPIDILPGSLLPGPSRTAEAPRPSRGRRLIGDPPDR